MTVPAGSYSDAVGNAGTAGSDSVSIDTLNPTVTVDIVDASLSDSDNSSVVTFEFSEDVTGFDLGDLTAVGGTLSNFQVVDGNSYTATFTATDGIRGDRLGECRGRQLHRRGRQHRRSRFGHRGDRHAQLFR